ncbi:hypothetical protein BH23THE1_BH23THE1_04100 [soil metagenome]
MNYEKSQVSSMIEFLQYINLIDIPDLYIRFDINIYKNILGKNMIKNRQDRENIILRNVIENCLPLYVSNINRSF